MAHCLPHCPAMRSSATYTMLSHGRMGFACGYTTPREYKCAKVTRMAKESLCLCQVQACPPCHRVSPVPRPPCPVLAMQRPTRCLWVMVGWRGVVATRESRGSTPATKSFITTNPPRHPAVRTAAHVCPPNPPLRRRTRGPQIARPGELRCSALSDLAVCDLVNGWECHCPLAASMAGVTGSSKTGASCHLVHVVRGGPQPCLSAAVVPVVCLSALALVPSALGLFKPA